MAFGQGLWSVVGGFNQSKTLVAVGPANFAHGRMAVTRRTAVMRPFYVRLTAVRPNIFHFVTFYRAEMHFISFRFVSIDDSTVH